MLSGHVVATGTIGQVYEALARELRLPAEQKPMELLLLIELMAHRAPTRFTDADAPVSQIKERPQLLVYRYASRASGPQSDGKETHLFHRCRHAMPQMPVTITNSSACKQQR